MDNKHLFYVEILVYPDYRDSFHSIMVEHSKNTLKNEPGCLVFDVLTDDSDSNEFGLFEVYADVMPEKESEEAEIEALSRSVVSQFEQYLKLNKKVSPEALVSVNQIEEYGKLVDTIASHLALKIPEKQELLEVDVVSERMEKVISFMEGEIGVLQVEKKIRSRVKRQMEKTQREYYLNEQLKAIQKELGESEEGKDELQAVSYTHLTLPTNREE